MFPGLKTFSVECLAAGSGPARAAARSRKALAEC